MQKLPKVADVASNIQSNGLSAYVNIDRDTAGRFGITPATVDNALYDAFGQRIVSTIFTQSGNQYRVILGPIRILQKPPFNHWGRFICPHRAADRCRCPGDRDHSSEQTSVPLEVDHLGHGSRR